MPEAPGHDLWTTKPVPVEPPVETAAVYHGWSLLNRNQPAPFHRGKVSAPSFPANANLVPGLMGSGIPTLPTNNGPFPPGLQPSMQGQMMHGTFPFVANFQFTGGLQ